MLQFYLIFYSKDCYWMSRRDFHKAIKFNFINLTLSTEQSPQLYLIFETCPDFFWRFNHILHSFTCIFAKCWQCLPVPLYVCYFPQKSGENFVGVFCDISLFPIKIHANFFSNNPWNYGSSYIEDKIKEVSFTLSVSPQEHWVMNKYFHVGVKSNNMFLQVSTLSNFAILELIFDKNRLFVYSLQCLIQTFSGHTVFLK